MLGHNPNLKEVKKFCTRRVKFAVRYTSPRSHSLHLAGTNDGPVTKAIFVFERSFQDITNDFHVPMTVSRESCPRLNSILVDDAQSTVSHEPWIVVVSEGKRV